MSTYTDASLIVTSNSKKAGKLYALKGADLDVVRATTATYVGSDGLIKTALANEVRFDYTNGNCPSILVEPQRTNLLLRSEEFDNAYWGKTLATVNKNTMISPSNNLTADEIVSTSTDNPFFQISLVNITRSATQYSQFFYFKNNNLSSSDTIQFAAFIAIQNQCRLNLNPTTMAFVGQTVNGDFSNFSYSVVSLQNNWFQVIINFTISASANSFSSRVTAGISTGMIKSFYLWGAQLEEGSNATSYIPTVASAVTRNADVISKTGISSLIGQTEGTIFVDFNKTKINLSILSIDDGTVNNRIFLEGAGTSTGLRVRVTNAGTTTVDNTSNVLQNGINKIAVVYANNNVSLYRNGVLIFNDNSATIPNTSILRIGSNVSNLFQLDDSINSAVLWKTALTSQECINLTTI